MEEGEEDMMGDVDEFDANSKASKYFPEVNEKFEEEVHYKDDSYKHHHLVHFFKENIAVDPIDGDDPTIYSFEESVGPWSFVDWRQDFDPKCAPPTYLPYKEVNSPLPTEKEDIFEKFEFCEKGGLRWTDEEAMERQKGVLKDVVKEFAKNFIRGLGISHMSLPVRMFEPRSTIQRVADYFCFAPIFLKRASKCTDKLERFKNVISYFIAGMQVWTGQLKPFNPILGETLQSTLPDGSNVYWEHISHHPPITAYSIEDVDHDYIFWGAAEFTANLGTNSMRAGQEGNCYIKFTDGQVIKTVAPHYTLGGTVMGDRTINADGFFLFEDEANQIKAVIIFNPIMKAGGIFSSNTYAGKTDDFRGLIYKPKAKKKKDKKKDKDKKFSKYKHMEEDAEEIYSEIEGSWLRELIIDGEEYWNINNPELRPQRHIPNTIALPSDWRFREDLIYLFRNNMKMADKWKVRLEVQQRLDRKHRKEADKKRKKGKKFIY